MEETNKKTSVIKLKRGETSIIDSAVVYYSILSSLGDWKLTERELQLVAFTAVKGNISYSNIREEFCTTYASSSATINNIIFKLKKKNIFVKDGSKVKIHPKLLQDFKNTIILQISLNG